MTASSVPNNPNFNQQWALQNTGQTGGTAGDDIGAVAAWNVTTGSNSIIVAVADTGIDYTDADLYQNIWINQAAIPASRLKNLVDVDHNGYISMADLNNPINQGPGKIEDLNHNGYIDAGDLLQPMILTANGQDSGLGGWVNPNVPDAADGLVGDLIGYNFNAGNDNPYDGNGHGTHVSGIIAGTGNAGGIMGIAPNVQLMPIEFLDSGGHGTVSEYIEGLNYAVSHGAKIVNNSWTGAALSQALTDAITNAKANGVIFVAAAGNSGTSNDTTPVYPANYSTALNNVVSVAASDANNTLASWSNFGANSVALAAPGVNILSTLPGGQYGQMSGTSMAAPLVSGVMALVWSEHPTWTYTQVINQVLSTVTKVPSLKGELSSGGILNAAAAVGATPVVTPPVVTVPATPPVVLSSKASGPTANSLSMIQLTFNRAINPSTFNAGDITFMGLGFYVNVTSVTVVAGSGNTVFDINFAAQTTPGPYTIYVGSTPRDMSGNAISRYETQFTIATPPPATAPAPTPPAAPSHVVSSTASGPTAKSLSMIQLTFNEPINPSTFNAGDITLMGLGFYVNVMSVTVVAGSGNTIFDINFGKQTIPGPYTVYVGSTPKDISGNPISRYETQFTISA